MSLKEMSITELRTENQLPDDVYDDGFLRVEHRNYYVACGGSRAEASAHRVSDLLAAGADAEPHRHGRRSLEFSLGRQQATQFREPSRLHLSPAGKARRFRTANRNDGQRRLPFDYACAGTAKELKHGSLTESSGGV